MSKELMKTDGGMSTEQIALVKDTICRGATNNELSMFIQCCNKLQLDPFARQIYAVKRWDGELKRMAMATQISIDGQRLVAERTGKYLGQTEAKWCDENRQWFDVWIDDKPPVAAKVGVYRDGFKEPIWGVARYKAYVQLKKDKTPNSMWQKMPDVMLAKCAEALALRKAFPNELSGLYTPEEMGQATQDTSPPKQIDSGPISLAEAKKIWDGHHEKLKKLSTEAKVEKINSFLKNFKVDDSDKNAYLDFVEYIHESVDITMDTGEPITDKIDPDQENTEPDIGNEDLFDDKPPEVQKKSAGDKLAKKVKND